MYKVLGYVTQCFWRDAGLSSLVSQLMVVHGRLIPPKFRANVVSSRVVSGWRRARDVAACMSTNRDADRFPGYFASTKRCLKVHAMVSVAEQGEVAIRITQV